MLKRLRGTFDKGLAAMSVKPGAPAESARFRGGCGLPVG